MIVDRAGVGKDNTPMAAFAVDGDLREILQRFHDQSAVTTVHPMPMSMAKAPPLKY